GLSGIHEIIDDQHTLAIAAAHLDDRVRHILQHARGALGLVIVVARDTHGFDQADFQFTRYNRGRHEPTARYANNGLEWPGSGEPPRERPRIPMELVP